MISFFRNPIKQRACLYLILSIALLLRVQHLTQPFIGLTSWRECSTAMMAENYYEDEWNIFYPRVNWVGTDIGYQGREFQLVSYSIALLYRVFGQHEWVARLLVVLFGVWGVFALYQLVRCIWDKKHALAAAFMMAVLPASVYIDRSFLPDPAMVSLVTTSLWLMVCYFQTGKRKYLFLGAAIGCLGFLTKITGMIVGLPMLYAAFTILKARGEWQKREIQRLLTTAIAVLLPVTAYYLWARHLTLTYPPHHFAGEGNWLWDDGLLNWIKNKYFFPVFYSRIAKALWGWPFLILLFLGLFASLLHRLFKRNAAKPELANKKGSYLFHAWLLGFAFFYFIGAREIVINPWNSYIFAPVVAAFSGKGILWIVSLSRRKTMKYLTATFIFLAIVISDYSRLKDLFHYRYVAADFQMGQSLRTLIAPGDLVVTFNSDPGDPIAIYYSRTRGWVFPPYGEKLGNPLSENDQENIASIERLRQKGAKWFAIVNHQYSLIKSNHPVFAEFLQKTYTIKVESKKFIIFKMGQ